MPDDRTVTVSYDDLRIVLGHVSDIRFSAQDVFDRLDAAKPNDPQPVSGGVEVAGQPYTVTFDADSEMVGKWRVDGPCFEPSWFTDERAAREEVADRNRAFAAGRARQYAVDLADALASSPDSETAGWQPIETAPQDRWILVLTTERNPVALGTWRGDGRSGSKWWDVPHRKYFTGAVTHWMPLPAAPSTQGEAKA